MVGRDVDRLQREIEELRRRLEEAEAPVRALRAGEVDAVFADEREAVFTLEPPTRIYSLLVEQIRQAAATLTDKGKVLHCNSRFVRLLDRPLGAIVGRPLLELAAPESRPALEVLLGEQRNGDTEVRFLHDDGVSSPVWLNATALEEGVLGSCVLVVDVTEQRHYQELRRAQEALRASEEALRAADQRKDEFMAMLAHELRNPLAPIRNTVELLKAGGMGEGETKWCYGVLDRQVQLVSRLLDDLFDVSRVSRQNLELRRVRVALADVVAAAVETSLPALEAGGHLLTVELPPEPVMLDADPSRLAQVFANLLNNAAKYTERGGQVHVAGERRGRMVTVSITDTGMGIEPAMLPTVFEMFARGGSAISRAQSGLGVGLPLARGLVELHGGTIEARSEGAGRGSTFSVHLPVADEPAADVGPDLASIERAAAGCRILIVDDNHDSADSMARLLELHGCRVATAYDGDEALESAAREQPEVVLLDLAMPNVDGYQTCQRLREQPWGRHAFVVALTGRGQDDDRRRVDASGFDRHLVKPVELETILSLLAESRRRTGGTSA